MFWKATGHVRVLLELSIVQIGYWRRNRVTSREIRHRRRLRAFGGPRPTAVYLEAVPSCILMQQSVARRCRTRMTIERARTIRARVPRLSRDTYRSLPNRRLDTLSRPWMRVSSTKTRLEILSLGAGSARTAASTRASGEMFVARTEFSLSWTAVFFARRALSPSRTCSF